MLADDEDDIPTAPTGIIFKYLTTRLLTDLVLTTEQCLIPVAPDLNYGRSLADEYIFEQLSYVFFLGSFVVSMCR